MKTITSIKSMGLLAICLSLSLNCFSAACPSDKPYLKNCEEAKEICVDRCYGECRSNCNFCREKWCDEAIGDCLKLGKSLGIAAPAGCYYPNRHVTSE